jgi:hypothetical protein
MYRNHIPAILLCCLISVYCLNARGQNVAVNSTGAAPHTSAMLDVSSNNKGFLPPRMTWTQIQAIPNPAAGLVVYDTGLKALRMFDGTAWIVLSAKQESLGDAPGSFSITPTGGTGILGVQDMYMRADKSVIVAGYVIGTGSIGTYSFTANGPYDMFLARLDSLGNVVWAQLIGGPGGDGAICVTVDASNNIYVGGSFQLTMDFDPGPGTQNLTSAGNADGFIAKYSSTGAWMWSQRVGGTTFDEVTNILTDGTNVYAAGRFTGSATFNPTPLTSFGADDIFLARYQASDGNMGSGWAIRIGGTNNESLSGMKLYAGNVLLNGGFQLTCDFGGMTRTSNGSYDGFYATYNSFGGLLNVAQIGGTGSDGLGGITSDAGGNIYITGTFNTTVDFDHGAGTQNRTSAGGSDLFVAKYTSGGAFSWVRTFGGTGEEYATGNFLEIDNTSNIYFASSFAQPVTYTPFPLVPYAANDIALIKMNTDGTILWVQQAGGPGSDSFSGLAVAPDGRLMFTSMYYSVSPGLTFKKTKTYSRFDILRYEE